MAALRLIGTGYQQPPCWLNCGSGARNHIKQHMYGASAIEHMLMSWHENIYIPH